MHKGKKRSDNETQSHVCVLHIIRVRVNRIRCAQECKNRRPTKTLLLQFHFQHVFNFGPLFLEISSMNEQKVDDGQMAPPFCKFTSYFAGE